MEAEGGSKPVRIGILTGAGASYGAGRLLTKAPPLGNGLYGELARRFPETWGNLRWDYKRPFLRDGFEAGMEQIWNKRLDMVQSMMIEMACYFSEFGPSEDKSDCYSRLASAIAASGMVAQVGCSTLNYDCAFDVAATRAGLKIRYLGHSEPHTSLAIWKLHGACNLVADSPRVEGITFVAQHIYKGVIKAVQLDEVRKLFGGESGSSIPPVMCVYMQGKPVQTAESALLQARSEWAEWASGATANVVIGVRPNLSEEYVWGPIMESQGKVYYVGSETGDYGRLSDILGDRLVRIGPTFEAAIERIVEYVESGGN